MQDVPLWKLTEIRDLVAKNRTPGIQKKAKGVGLETVGSKRLERLCECLTVFLMCMHREGVLAHDLEVRLCQFCCLGNAIDWDAIFPMHKLINLHLKAIPES